MNEAVRTCPYCEKPARSALIPTRVKRGDRVLSVPLETWECESGCRSEDGSRPFAFSDQAQAQRNDPLIRAAWREAFGEEIPEAKRPGRKPQEPRNRTVQVKLTERELRELDQRRGEASRSEYIRSHALPFEGRTG
jgi:hypothetical protein